MHPITTYKTNMNTPYFTIILPIHREPLYLPLSVESVMNQSFGNFELFIVLDGAPDETYNCAKKFSTSDDRIKVFKFSKGKRHGETHRASALKEASGQVITHINDDSLWLPDHLATIYKDGANFDFGHTLHTRILKDDKIKSTTKYLENPKIKDKMLSEHLNIANMCDVFYTRETYINLPEKWTPAPEDIWSDLYMWRKFLKQNIKFGTIHRPTALFFDYPKNYSDEESYNRINKWLQQIKTSNGCSNIRGEVKKIQATASLKALRKQNFFLWLIRMFFPKEKT